MENRSPPQKKHLQFQLGEMALEHAEEKQPQHSGQLDCTYPFTSLHYMGVSLNGGTPKTHQNDHF